MRHSQLAVAFVLAASPAGAQPVTEPSACSVTIARAPDEVRRAVEEWIAAEPHCSAALEVRIVPTEGGYYLLARDEQGRTHERIVPDPQSAGVLVASWAADDSASSAREMPERARVPRVTDATSGDEGARVPGSAPAIIATGSSAPATLSPWVTVGGLLRMQGGGGEGFRAEVDVMTRQRWALGVATSYSNSSIYNEVFFGFQRTTDAKAMATLSRTTQLGRWHLRAALGAGLVYSNVDARLTDDRTLEQVDIDAARTFLTAEGQLAIARELGKSWALAAGPLVSLYSQSYAVTTMPMFAQPRVVSVERNNTELMLYVGVRHRL